MKGKMICQFQEFMKEFTIVYCLSINSLMSLKIDNDYVICIFNTIKKGSKSSIYKYVSLYTFSFKFFPN